MVNQAVAEYFASKGWNATGGIEGDAPYLTLNNLNRQLVLAIGGAGDQTPSADEDYTNAPVDLDYPCRLHVYYGPFDETNPDPIPLIMQFDNVIAAFRLVEMIQHYVR